MKNILLLIVIFCFGSNLMAQKGFKYIKKAEKSFEKGNYEKTNKLLTKAEKADYGFCGNFWWEAETEIVNIKVKMALSKGDTLKAIALVDSSSIIGDEVFNADSVKIVLFQNKLGKEYVKKSLETAVVNAKFEGDRYANKIFVKLRFGIEENELNLSLTRFKFPITLNLYDRGNVNQEFAINQFIREFKKSSYYKQLFAN